MFAAMAASLPGERERASCTAIRHADASPTALAICPRPRHLVENLLRGVAEEVAAHARRFAEEGASDPLVDHMRAEQVQRLLLLEERFGIDDALRARIIRGFPQEPGEELHREVLAPRHGAADDHDPELLPLALAQVAAPLGHLLVERPDLFLG